MSRADSFSDSPRTSSSRRFVRGALRATSTKASSAITHLRGMSRTRACCSRHDASSRTMASWRRDSDEVRFTLRHISRGSAS